MRGGSSRARLGIGGAGGVLGGQRLAIAGRREPIPQPIQFREDRIDNRRWQRQPREGRDERHRRGGRRLGGVRFGGLGKQRGKALGGPSLRRGALACLTTAIVARMTRLKLALTLGVGQCRCATQHMFNDIGHPPRELNTIVPIIPIAHRVR